jgi:hypothetical protein
MLSFLFVRNSKSNSRPEKAIANLKNKIRTRVKCTISPLMSHPEISQFQNVNRKNN